MIVAHTCTMSKEQVSESVDPQIDITEEQSKDNDIAKIKKLKLSKAERPSWQQVAPESRDFKSYWAQWDRLEMVNGVLC